VCENELGFFDWILKVNEKLMFAILSIKEHRDISEEDYGLLKALHDRVCMWGLILCIKQNGYICRNCRSDTSLLTIRQSPPPNNVDGTEVENYLYGQLKTKRDNLFGYYDTYFRNFGSPSITSIQCTTPKRMVSTPQGLSEETGRIQRGKIKELQTKMKN